MSDKRWLLVEVIDLLHGVADYQAQVQAVADKLDRSIAGCQCQTCSESLESIGFLLKIYLDASASDRLKEAITILNKLRVP